MLRVERKRTGEKKCRKKYRLLNMFVLFYEPFLFKLNFPNQISEIGTLSLAI